MFRKESLKGNAFLVGETHTPKMKLEKVKDKKIKIGKLHQLTKLVQGQDELEEFEGTDLDKETKRSSFHQHKKRHTKVSEQGTRADIRSTKRRRQRR